MTDAISRQKFMEELRRYQKGSVTRRHFLGVTGLGAATLALSAAMPRGAWAQSLGQPAAAAPAEALLRLEIAADVPTPAEQLSDRRLLQLQLLTRRHAAAPADTWAQDVADLLASAHDERAARRLQNALKALLKR